MMATKLGIPSHPAIQRAQRECLMLLGFGGKGSFTSRARWHSRMRFEQINKP